MSGHGRVRERIIPSKNGNNFSIWGAYLREQTFMQEDWIKFDTYTNSPAVPFALGERTSDTLHHGPPYREGSGYENIKIRHESANNWPIANGSYTTELRVSFWPYFARIRYVGAGFGFPIGWGTAIDSMNLLTPQLAGAAVPSTGTLDSMVWDKTKPKIEQGGLFVAIAELRDIPHMLEGSFGKLSIPDLKRRALHWRDAYENLLSSSGRSKIKDNLNPWRMSKKAAGHFLNHNFGWVPFVKDVYSLCDNVVNAQSKIDRLSDENDRWVRRRAILVNQTDESLLAQSDGILLPGPAADESFRAIVGGHYQQPHWENHEEKWTFAQSVGSFRYYLPEFDRSLPDYSGALNTVKRQIDIHGARINPSNIYKAVPWTWLIDWVSSTGKIIQSVQDQAMDNMAARYLYLVHHQVKTLTLKQYVPFNSLSGGPKTFEIRQIIDVKQRKEATPFGFDLTWDTLTPKQLAILGALGITRKH